MALPPWMGFFAHFFRRVDNWFLRPFHRLPSLLRSILFRLHLSPSSTTTAATPSPSCSCCQRAIKPRPSDFRTSTLSRDWLDMTTEELDAEMKRQQDKGPYMAPPEDVAYHKKYMRQALDMGEMALTQFNEVPVGCVFVHNNEVIGRGMNDTNRSLCGTRHAEFIAIESILLKYPPSIFRETDLYVTVEPCIMCASALRQLQIRRVFFGCMNERFGGTGGVLKVHEDLSLEPPYKVYGGINHDEAIMLLRRFYIQENGKAPQPITKKQRKLKLEIAPFAGENKLDGVGEGRVMMEFMGADGANSSSGNCSVEGSGVESGAESGADDGALKEVQEEMTDMGMTSGSDRDSSPEAEEPKAATGTA